MPKRRSHAERCRSSANRPWMYVPLTRPSAETAPFGQAHVHLISREGEPVAGRAVHRLEALVCGQKRLDIEQAETIRGTSAPFDCVRIPYGASQHLISA